MNKFFKLAASLLLSAVAFAQTHQAANLDTQNTFTAANQFSVGVQTGPVTFAQLAAILNPSDGNIIWVTDGTTTNPCAGSGSGAFAFRVNGIWNCSVASSVATTGTVNTGTINVLYKNVAPATAGNSSITDNGATVVTTEPFSATTLTSTIAIGTAPLTVTSTTVVPNLNVSQLLGNTWASPGTIGGTTPGNATFNNLTINGTCTGCMGTVTHTAGALAAGNFVLGNSGGDVIDSGFAIVPVASGGTGTATPGLVGGTNITITGSWPNQTVTASTDASTLLTGTWAIPGIIGATIPNSATFTNLTVTGTCTGCGGGGGGGGTWGSITGTLSAQTDLQTALNAKLATGLAVLLVPAATQTLQPSGSTAVGLIAKCPGGAASSLACLQVQDNAGGIIVSFLQNDSIQFGTGVGGTMQLTGVLGPNANPATAGLIRNSSTDIGIAWRNNANTGNLGIAKTAADILTSDMAVAIKETVAGAGIAGYAVLYEDSSTHILQASLNNGSFLTVPLETGAMTSGHVVSVNATTNLVQDSGFAAASVLLGAPTNHGVAVGAATQTTTYTSAGTSGQCLLSNGASADPSFGTCPSASTSTLSGLTAALAGNSINNGDFAQVWNFQGTTSGRTSFLFTENAASTSAGTPVLVAVRTIATSTMNPFEMSANGNGLRMDTTGKLAKIGTGSLDVNSLSSVTGSGAAVLATSATSVTLDAEGTSNVLTRPFYVEFASSCSATTASQGSFDFPTATAATPNCFGTTTTQGVLDYVDASTTTATGHFTLPQGWAGNMDARIYWFANASSANAVRWSVQTGCVADAAAVSTGPSYNTASQTNTAYTGTANQRKTTTLSAISMTNCAAGNEMWFQLSRIGGDAGDTLTATAELLSVQFEGRYTK